MSYHIQSEATDLATTTTHLFVDELKDWLRDQLITKVLAKIVGLFVPGGNALVIIDTIYTAFTTIRDYAAQFQSLFNTLSQSVAALANGDRSQAVSQLKAVLHDATAIAIGFLAKFAGFHKISQQVKAAIHKAEKQLKEVFEKIKKKVLVKVEAFIGGKGKDKKNGGKEDDGKKKDNEINSSEGQLIGKKLDFKTQEHGKTKTHYLYAIAKNNNAEIIVRSKPTILLNKLITWKGAINSLPTGQQSKALGWIEDARKQYFVVKKEAKKELEKEHSGVLTTEQTKLIPILQAIFELYGEQDTERPILNVQTQITHNLSKKYSEAFVTKKHNGSKQPTENIPGWEEAAVLNAYKSGLYWDRAHKISHRLGGKGSNSNNLFFTTKKFNTGILGPIERNAESLLKELINLNGRFKNQENTFKNKILFYKIKYQPYPAPYDNFPYEVFISFGTCNADGKKDSNDLTINPEPLQNPTDPSTINGEININDISEKTIEKVVKKLVNNDTSKILSRAFCQYLKDYSRRNKQNNVDYRYINYEDVRDRLNYARNQAKETGIAPTTLEDGLEKLKYLIDNNIIIIKR